MKESFESFTPGKDDLGRRLDRIVRKLLPGLPLSRIYAAFRKGDIRISGKKAAPSELIRENDVLFIHRSILRSAQGGTGECPVNRTADPADYRPPDISRLILADNENIIVINKPKGVLVHDGVNSLEQSVRAALKNRIPESLGFTPGPLHRLDRNTSGLIMFSSSILGAHTGTAFFREGKIEKYYLALLDGTIRNEEIWKENLTRDERTLRTERAESGVGKTASTRCIPLIHGNRHTLCLILIEGGRTHQIRAHSALHGHPLSGDVKYKGSFLEGGYLLHSWGVRIMERSSVFGFESLSAPLFPEFERAIEQLFAKALHKIPSFYAILEAGR